ncbi:NADPH-dependent F420 reductase [Kytococcus schroeteri]|uniref:NADPH-dependent F420 reductase n=1 Tax=Kytococcus schroeteri TaxID=138300 RepID=UPI001142B3B1|nr:hypothetical protein [Kytococcus schroeteri]
MRHCTVGGVRESGADAREHGIERRTRVDQLDVLGAGRMGRALAGRAAARGLGVRVHRRLHLMPAGSPAVPVVLALPLEHLEELDPELLAGRVVVDAMNAWGDAAELMPAAVHPEGTSGAVAEHLRHSQVVKAFNHLSYHDVEVVPGGAGGAAGAGGDLKARGPGRADPASGTDHRRALLVAGDDPAARTVVAELVVAMGFAPVEAPLAHGRLAEPGNPLFGQHLTTDGMRAILTRHRPRAA